MQFDENTLFYGDCLEVMRQWTGEQVDLIYLDPPFNSNTNYNQLFGTENGVSAQVLAFQDTWRWNEQAAERIHRIGNAVAHPAHAVVTTMHEILGPCGMLAYISYMAERLVECHRLLKPTGSLYLHCDPTASHYLKIMVDSIFGQKSFRNEIVWHYSSSARGAKAVAKQFPKNNDTILFYAKSESYTYNRQTRIEKIKFQGSNYRIDDQGRCFRTAPRGDYTDASIEKLRKEGRIHTTKTGNIRIKYFEPYDGEYVHETRPCGNVWNDIPDAMHLPKSERMGYPTQKPLALLERIVAASSNPGDLVLDPFCGCGTTIAAARNLDRRWIGIDISPFATELIRKRLKDPSITIEGIPTSLGGAKRLLDNNPLDYEAWIISCLQGVAPNQKRTGDRGIDGRGKLIHPDQEGRSLVLAQVKGGGATTGSVRDFLHVLGRDKAALGVFITHSAHVSDGCRAEAKLAGRIKVNNVEYDRLVFWSAEEYLEGRRQPQVPPMADPYTGKEVQGELEV